MSTLRGGGGGGHYHLVSYQRWPILRLTQARLVMNLRSHVCIVYIFESAGHLVVVGLVQVYIVVPQSKQHLRATPTGQV